MADGHIKISTEIDNSQAIESFNELERAIKAHAGESESVLNNELQRMLNNYDRLGDKLSATQTDIDNYREAIDNLNWSLAQNKSGDIPLNEAEVGAINRELQETGSALEKATLEANRLALNMDKVKISAQSKANKLNEGALKAKELDLNIKGASRSAKDLDGSIGKGVKKMGRYALAVFGVRSAYMMIRRLANNVINANDEMGERLRAQVSGITNAVSSLLAPAIQWLVNLASTLVGYLASALKVLFGIDLKTKSTNKNTGGVAKGVKNANKEAKKFLASFDEIEKITSDTSDNLDSGIGGIDDGVATVEFTEPDTSLFKQALEAMKADLKPFIDLVKSIDLQPLQHSFGRLKDAVVDFAGVAYNSFINIMNDSIGPFIKVMTEEIVPHALNAVSGAIEMLTPHFENLMTNYVEPFVNWLLTEYLPVWYEFLITAFETLTIVVGDVLDGFFEFWEFIKPFAEFLGDVLVEIIGLLTDELSDWNQKNKDADSEGRNLWKTLGLLLGAFVALKMIAGITALLGGLGVAFATVAGWVATFFGVLKAIGLFLATAFSGNILAIIALVTLLTLAVVGIATNFDQVMKDIRQIIDNIIGFFEGLIDFVAGVFTGDWGRAWDGLVGMVSNAFEGLVNIVKFPINVIIDGVNAMIRGLNKFKVPSWVPLVGGRGINIPQVPRLQRGAIINRPTQALVGDGGAEALFPIENDTRGLQRVADILMEHMGSGGGKQVIKVNIGSKELFEIILDEKERREMMKGGNLSYDF